jgi:hypothetical protein
MNMNDVILNLLVDSDQTHFNDLVRIIIDIQFSSFLRHCFHQTGCPGLHCGPQ